MTGIALFSSIAIILNYSHLQFPAPYAPFLIYDVWEIPIVSSLLILGLYPSLMVAAVNTSVLLLINPGALGSGPIYNFIAVMVTLVAVSVARKISRKLELGQNTSMGLATTFAVIARAPALVLVNYVLLPFPPPLGYSIPESAAALYLPVVAIFNATLLLYTVPFAFGIMKAVSTRIRGQTSYFA